MTCIQEDYLRKHSGSTPKIKKGEQDEAEGEAEMWCVSMERSDGAMMSSETIMANRVASNWGKGIRLCPSLIKHSLDMCCPGKES